MAIRIGRWDCKSCGHRGNLGNVIHCEQCNAPRGKDVEFYLPEDAPEVTDQTLINEANAGADWVCSYCQSANKATETHCHTCGNDRDAKEDRNLIEREYDLTNTPKTSADADTISKAQKEQERAAKKQRYLVDEHTEEKEVVKGSKIAKINKWVTGLTIISTIILSLVGFLYIPNYGNKTEWHSILNFTTHDYLPSLSFQNAVHSQTEEVVYDISGFYWQRVIPIEKGEDVPYEDWSVPSGGKYVSSFSAIHHYDKVQDGYETKTRSVKVASGTRRYKCGTKSKGNGYFEDKYCTETTYTTKNETYSVPRYKDVPVYRTKYRYTMREWQFHHNEVSEANDTKPYWATYGSQYKGDKWRQGEKRELYQVYIQHQNDKAQYEIDFEDWQHFTKQKTITVKQAIAAFAPTKSALLEAK